MTPAEQNGTETGNRLVYKLKDLKDFGPYAKPKYWERCEPVDLWEGNVTSSKTNTNCHLPTLDIDIPVTRTPDGTLWFDTNTTPRKWKKLIQLLQEHNIIQPATQPGTRTQRQQEYHQHRHQCDFGQHYKTTLITLCENSESKLDDAMYAAAQFAYRDNTHSPRYHNPWPINLQTPNYLIPSTNNHHLYINIPLTWNAYQQLLKQLHKNGIIERSWYKASKKAKQTYIRLPWQTKTNTDNK